MDQKVRIYNVIANSGWLKCGPWAAVNLFECTKEGQSMRHVSKKNKNASKKKYPARIKKNKNASKKKYPDATV